MIRDGGSRVLFFGIITSATDSMALSALTCTGTLFQKKPVGIVQGSRCQQKLKSSH